MTTTTEHLTFRTNDGARCFNNCPACATERMQGEATECYWGQHDINPGKPETLYLGNGGEVSHLRCVPASELRGADVD